MTAIPVYESAEREQLRPAFGRCLCYHLSDHGNSARKQREDCENSKPDRDHGWIDIIAL